MKRPRLVLIAVVLACSTGLAAKEAPPDRLPYAEAGLTERQAAAHLLSRFTYGARPGDVDRVVDMGLEQWLDRQLDASFSDRALKKRLAPFKALDLPPMVLAEKYIKPNEAIDRVARVSKMTREELYEGFNTPEVQQQIRAYLDKNGLRPERELIAELLGQKLLRAVYSEKQLAEVLTDFWFNHFNVALQDASARPYVLPYERDAIRPHVLGSFRAMLGATARHPAMLLYLDNAQSSAPEGVVTTMDVYRRRHLNNRNPTPQPKTSDTAKPKRDINENYARELMELHTLGVDGGYTQHDVVDVARAFTGWTYVRSYEHENQVRKHMEERDKLLGFVLDDVFYFNANLHDATPKTILNVSFPPGGGIDEGQRVLDLLALHPATAEHLARKIATRFVNDTPPQELIEHLADVFLQSDSDLQTVVRALAYSPHFWNEHARQTKIKTPFEVAVSALRALDADVRPTRALLAWIDRMGQPLYRQAAPTGFPDEASYWINAGSLLNRMGFGMSLATGQVEGVRFDLLGLNGDREPESVAEALSVYVALLMPERAVAEVTAMLLPMATDPNLQTRLEATAETSRDTAPMEDAEILAGLASSASSSSAASAPVPASLARTVGVILGSPAFQRR